MSTPTSQLRSTEDLGYLASDFAFSTNQCGEVFEYCKKRSYEARAVRSGNWKHAIHHVRPIRVP